jgi:hypothetical protein
VQVVDKEATRERDVAQVISHPIRHIEQLAALLDQPPISRQDHASDRDPMALEPS